MLLLILFYSISQTLIYPYHNEGQRELFFSISSLPVWDPTSPISLHWFDLIDCFYGLFPGKWSKKAKIWTKGVCIFFHVWALQCTVCVSSMCVPAPLLPPTCWCLDEWLSTPGPLLDESALTTAVTCSFCCCLKECWCVWCNYALLCYSFGSVTCESTPAGVHTHTLFTRVQLILCPLKPPVSPTPTLTFIDPLEPMQ